MRRFPRLLRLLIRLACTLLILLVDAVRFLLLCLRPSPALARIVKIFKCICLPKVTYQPSCLFRLSSAPQSSILDVPVERRVGRGRAMDWKQLLAYMTGSVDEELLLRNEYLVTENRILRQQIKGRVQLTDAERRSLAEIGKQLSKKALEEVASLVKPDTILRWHRQLVAQKFDGSKQRQALGRP